MIHELSKKQRSLSIFIRLNQLQAKLAVIEGDLNRANKILGELKEIVESTGFKLLHNKIVEEMKSLKKQFSDWGDIVKKNKSLWIEIKNQELKKYFEDIKPILGNYPD